MCGILGYVVRSPNAPALEPGVDALAHRGPDDAGVLYRDFETGAGTYRAGFGHRRLAILDLSAAGHQPMQGTTADVWITYNGEVYNFRELRSELQGLGHAFSTETDTEVLIRAYEVWGAGFVDRLDGMFAFAILDLREKRIVLARDRLGIKPLYVVPVGDGFAFGSEVRGLIDTGLYEVTPNWPVMLSHLSLLWAPEPKTVFDGVEKVPAGEYWIWENGDFERTRYWDIDLAAEADHSVEVLDELLGKAVENRMVSDVPVGSLLSGGLDSSLITALMAREAGRGLDTYSIAFRSDDQSFEAMPPDAQYAQQVANRLETNHHEIEINPDIADLLPALLGHLEEPIADPAAINTYLICRMARDRGTKVLLSGMGADEIFGGYRKHLSVLIAAAYRKAVPSVVRDQVIHPLIGALPAGGQKSGYRYFRWAKRFAASASLPDVDCFIGNSSYYPWPDLEDLLEPDRRSDYADTYSVESHRQRFETSADRDLLTQMTYTDAKLFLAGLNLAYTDRASMAASVEVRVPFLDHRLVDLAINLPRRQRIRGAKQKLLLRQVAYKYLPRQIVDRPKAPFGAPLRSWMRRDLRPLLEEYLSEKRIKERGYFRYEAVRAMIDANTSGREDYAHRLWGLLTIELWHRIFVDKEITPSLPS